MVNDPVERNSKLFFQVLEVMVLIGWPALVFLCCFLIFGPVTAAILGLIVLFLPKIKILYSEFLAKKNKVKDPRQELRSSSFWFDGFMFYGSDVLRAIRQNAALSKSLDVIYNYFDRFGIRPEGFEADWHTKYPVVVSSLIKSWTNLWVAMPIAQDVRTRLDVVKNEISSAILKKHLKTGQVEFNIVLLAGGTKQDVIMAAAELEKGIPGIKLNIVCVEPDGKFAVNRSKKLVKAFGVKNSTFVDIFKQVCLDDGNEKILATILNERGYDFNAFDMVICIGLGDYMFGYRLSKFLKMLDNGNIIITANVCGNYIERFFLHFLIQWPRMQYLSVYKYANVLEENYPNRNISIIRTPNKIFNIAIVE